MKVLNQTESSSAPGQVERGEFNTCEHLYVQIEPGRNQTISARLPNGKFVTFAFITGAGDEMECVDLHSTVGASFPRGNGWGLEAKSYPHHLIGFTPGSGTFDTRKLEKVTTLATLLLNAHYYAPPAPVAESGVNP